MHYLFWCFNAARNYGKLAYILIPFKYLASFLVDQ